MCVAWCWRRSQEIGPQAEPDGVFLYWLMNLCTFSRRDSVLTRSRDTLSGAIKVQEITGRWSILLKWNLIRQQGLPFWKPAAWDVGQQHSNETEGLFFASAPSPARQIYHSKDFWNVSSHAKFMLNHKRDPSHNREQPLNNSAFVLLWLLSKAEAFKRGGWGGGPVIRACVGGCISEHRRPCSRLDLNRSDLSQGQGLTPSRCHPLTISHLSTSFHDMPAYECFEGARVLYPEWCQATYCD